MELSPVIISVVTFKVSSFDLFKFKSRNADLFGYQIKMKRENKSRNYDSKRRFFEQMFLAGMQSSHVNGMFCFDEACDPSIATI